MKMKPFPCYCDNCKWAVSEDDKTRYFLRCTNPIVNSKNPYSLGRGRDAKQFGGVDCKEIRAGKWFRTCGIKGKLWEPVETTKEI